MRKAIFLLSAIIVVCSCNENKQENPGSDKRVPKLELEKQITNKTIDNTIKPKRIGDYMSDTTDYFWNSKQSESGNYWVRIVFQKEFIVYQFHGQCLYWFFTHHFHTGTDKVELLWSYKTDCLLDMNFLRQSNGVKKYPKFGDAFCEYKLVNDTVIEVKYNFPEWTNKINEMEKDSIFPKYFYLQKN